MKNWWEEGLIYQSDPDDPDFEPPESDIEADDGSDSGDSGVEEDEATRIEGDDVGIDGDRASDGEENREDDGDIASDGDVNLEDDGDRDESQKKRTTKSIWELKKKNENDVVFFLFLMS